MLGAERGLVRPGPGRPTVGPVRDRRAAQRPYRRRRPPPGTGDGSPRRGFLRDLGPVRRRPSDRDATVIMSGATRRSAASADDVSTAQSSAARKFSMSCRRVRQPTRAGRGRGGADRPPPRLRRSGRRGAAGRWRPRPLLEPLLRVLPDRLEQAIADRSPVVVDDAPATCRRAGEHVERRRTRRVVGGDDRFRSVEVAAAGEHREPVEPSCSSASSRSYDQSIVFRSV